MSGQEPLFATVTDYAADPGQRKTRFEAGQRAKEEAVDRVGRNADPDWSTVAYAVVCGLARTYAWFSTDDVWDQLDGYEDLSTHEPRAMGAVMQRAARAGVIAKTDRTIPSVRPECHGREVRVWESRAR